MIGCGQLDSHFTNEIYEQIWKDRYKKNDETYDQNLQRVAKFISKAEQYEDQAYYENEFYQVMRKGLFFPAGRTMSNAGIGEKLTLNNCFLAPLMEDSMEGIFDSVKLGAITHKAGGGIGYSLSNLSPRGRITSNDATASGPVSFLDVFDSQTATISAGSRRGANMAVLSVYHPDIEEFITAKSKDPNRLQHFNLSVMVDDTFMITVDRDRSIKLHWPIYDEYGNVLHEKDWNPQFTKEVNAKELWDKIMRYAYDTGEPSLYSGFVKPFEMLEA